LSRSYLDVAAAVEEKASMHSRAAAAVEEEAGMHVR
jgi:hypothetical protein